MKRKFKGNGFQAAEALYGPPKPGSTQLSLDLTDRKEKENIAMDPDHSHPIFDKMDRTGIYYPKRTSLYKEK